MKADDGFHPVPDRPSSPRVIPVTTEFAEAEISSSSAMQKEASGRAALRTRRAGVSIGLEAAKVITAAVWAAGEERGLKPLTVVVLDAGGHVVSAEREDGASNNRFEIAYGALALGTGSRSLMARAEQQPYFITAAPAATGGRLVPVPGGVLVKDEAGAVLGCVGVSGDTSDNDELAAIAAIAGITSASLVPQPG